MLKYKIKVFAFVTGNAGNYEVVIDLEDFSESNCECPYENYCKHMAAVVYDMRVQLKRN